MVGGTRDRVPPPDCFSSDRDPGPDHGLPAVPVHIGRDCIWTPVPMRDGATPRCAHRTTLICVTQTPSDTANVADGLPSTCEKKSTRTASARKSTAARSATRKPLGCSATGLTATPDRSMTSCSRQGRPRAVSFGRSFVWSRPGTRVSGWNIRAVGSLRASGGVFL